MKAQIETGLKINSKGLIKLSGNRFYDMIKKVKLLLVFLLITLSSCSHYYYVANVQNVPLLKEKNETRFNLSLSTKGIEESFSTDVQAAYAITDKIAVISDFMFTKNNNSDNNSAKGTYFDGGLGYYKPFSKSMVFELYGGVGISSQHHKYYSYVIDQLLWPFPIPLGHYEYTGKADLTYSKLFLQPSLGMSFNWADMAFSLPVSKVKFTKIDYNIIGSDKYGLDLISLNRSSLLLEPALTIRVGWKYLKFQFQYIYSINLTNKDLPFEPDKLSLGLNVSIAGRYLKKN